MEGTTWRCARAFEQDPSGLVDPRRPGPMSAAIPEEQVHRVARAKPFAFVTKPGLCGTCGGPCIRIFLDPRVAMPGRARPVRGGLGLLRRLVQTSRAGASTQRHGGERRHLLGTPPESGSRQARPSESMKSLGAN